MQLISLLPGEGTVQIASRKQRKPFGCTLITSLPFRIFLPNSMLASFLTAWRLVEGGCPFGLRLSRYVRSCLDGEHLQFYDDDEVDDDDDDDDNDDDGECLLAPFRCRRFRLSEILLKKAFRLEEINSSCA